MGRRSDKPNWVASRRSIGIRRTAGIGAVASRSLCSTASISGAGGSFTALPSAQALRKASPTSRRQKGWRSPVARHHNPALRLLLWLGVMTDVPIEEAKLIGGSPQDRRRLLERLHEYLDINARFDWEPLQDLWSGMPETVFFNLNGHT